MHTKTEPTLVCFLAFALWKVLQGWQTRAGLGTSPRTVLEELQRVVAVDVVFPMEDHGEMRLRCVSEPDPDTAVILERLGLEVPKRLKAPSVVARM